MCAEQSALSAAHQAFGLDKVKRIAVAGGDASSGALTGGGVCTPCGGCRQAILEAAQLGNTDIEIVCASGDGSVTQTHRIGDLIPHGFGPANLADAG